MSIELDCDMHFEYYPMDIQICELQLQSCECTAYQRSSVSEINNSLSIIISLPNLPHIMLSGTKTHQHVFISFFLNFAMIGHDYFLTIRAVEWVMRLSKQPAALWSIQTRSDCDRKWELLCPLASSHCRSVWVLMCFFY